MRYRYMTNCSIFIFLLLVIISPSYLLAEDETFHDHVNALKPIGNPAPAVTLASDGKAVYTLLLPANPTPKDQYAASELAHWLHQITNATFSVITEGKGASPARFISIGLTRALQQTDLVNSATKLKPTELVIGQVNGNIYLFGGSRRGPIFAVYALLEEDLNCRWYSPDCTVIPHRRDLTVSIVPRAYNPPLPDMRYPLYGEQRGPWEWQLRNHLNNRDSHIPEELGGYPHYPKHNWFVHTYKFLLPAKDYFHSHPEYYALYHNQRKQVQLCETNEQVIQLATAKVHQVLTDHPKATIISISRDDGRIYCQDSGCKSIDNHNNSTAASQLHLVNAVAEMVAKHFPNVTVSTLAYGESIIPPAHLRPASNVVIWLCDDLHAWRYPLVSLTKTNDDRTVRYREAIANWSHITSRLYVWEYTSNYSHYLAPFPNMSILAPELQYYINHHVTGVMFQGDYNGKYSERAAMRVWVMAQLLWNPSLGTDTLMRDFVQGYYGKAAAPIEAYNTLLHKVSRPYIGQKLPHGIRYPMDVEFLSKSFILQALSLFDHAQVLAEDNPVLLNRVNLAKLSILYVILNRRADFSEKRYASALTEFESIAKKNHIKYLSETRQPDLQKHLNIWRQQTRRSPSS